MQCNFDLTLYYLLLCMSKELGCLLSSHRVRTSMAAITVIFLPSFSYLSNGPHVINYRICIPLLLCISVRYIAGTVVVHRRTYMLTAVAQLPPHHLYTAVKPSGPAYVQTTQALVRINNTHKSIPQAAGTKLAYKTRDGGCSQCPG